MYGGDVTSMRIIVGDRKEFPVTMDITLGLCIKLLLIYLSYRWANQQKTRWDPMVYAIRYNNIVLIDENSESVDWKLEIWRNILESKSFKIGKKY